VPAGAHHALNAPDETFQQVDSNGFRVMHTRASVLARTKFFKATKKTDLFFAAA
jgi:hypothetical protein